MGQSKMFLNQGGLKFKDVTQETGISSPNGWTTGVSVVDINNDGFLDFYVCRGGVEINDTRRNRLYVNNGNLTFTERAGEYGLDDQSASTGANFFDWLGSHLSLGLVRLKTVKITGVRMPPPR